MDASAYERLEKLARETADALIRCNQNEEKAAAREEKLFIELGQLKTRIDLKVEEVKRELKREIDLVARVLSREHGYANGSDDFSDDDEPTDHGQRVKMDVQKSRFLKSEAREAKGLRSEVSALRQRMESSESIAKAIEENSVKAQKHATERLKFWISVMTLISLIAGGLGAFVHYVVTERP